MPPSTVSRAYVFTYPYWIYTSNTNPPRPIQATFQQHRIRFYPPFRNAPWDSINHSRLAQSSKVPFIPGRQPEDKKFKITPPPIMIPYLDDAGKPAALACVTMPDGSSEPPPEHLLPKDGLRIDVTGSDLNQMGNVAYEVNKHLTQLLRWRSGQWWITRSTFGLTHFGALDFDVTSDGRYIKRPEYPAGVTAVRTFRGDEHYIDDAIWQLAINDLSIGNDVPIHELLLADAKYFQSTGDLRQAVLGADGACEYLKDIVFGNLWLAKNPGKVYDQAKRDDLLRNWDLPRHIDVKFQNHFGRSYRTEHLAEWEEINKLWMTRNNLAHGGANEFGTPPIKVDDAIFKTFLEAAIHCTGWLLSL